MAVRDDFYSQAWAGNHQHLSKTIHKLVRAAMDAFDRLQAHQFDAPWRARRAKGKAPAFKPAA
jgi:hypothetical protein